MGGDEYQAQQNQQPQTPAQSNGGSWFDDLGKTFNNMTNMATQVVKPVADWVTGSLTPTTSQVQQKINSLAQYKPSAYQPDPNINFNVAYTPDNIMRWMNQGAVQYQPDGVNSGKVYRTYKDLDGSIKTEKLPFMQVDNGDTKPIKYGQDISNRITQTLGLPDWATTGLDVVNNITPGMQATTAGLNAIINMVAPQTNEQLTQKARTPLGTTGAFTGVQNPYEDIVNKIQNLITQQKNVVRPEVLKEGTSGENSLRQYGQMASDIAGAIAIGAATGGAGLGTIGTSTALTIPQAIGNVQDALDQKSTATGALAKTAVDYMTNALFIKGAHNIWADPTNTIPKAIWKSALKSAAISLPSTAATETFNVLEGKTPNGWSDYWQNVIKGTALQTVMFTAMDLPMVKARIAAGKDFGTDADVWKARVYDVMAEAKANGDKAGQTAKDNLYTDFQNSYKSGKPYTNISEMPASKIKKMDNFFRGYKKVIENDPDAIDRLNMMVAQKAKAGQEVPNPSYEAPPTTPALSAPISDVPNESYTEKGRPVDSYTPEEKKNVAFDVSDNISKADLNNVKADHPEVVEKYGIKNYFDAPNGEKITKDANGNKIKPYLDTSNPEGHKYMEAQFQKINQRLPDTPEEFGKFVSDWMNNKPVMPDENVNETISDINTKDLKGETTPDEKALRQAAVNTRYSNLMTNETPETVIRRLQNHKDIDGTRSPLLGKTQGMTSAQKMQKIKTMIEASPDLKELQPVGAVETPKPIETVKPEAEAVSEPQAEATDIYQRDEQGRKVYPPSENKKSFEQESAIEGKPSKQEVATQKTEPPKVESPQLLAKNESRKLETATKPFDSAKETYIDKKAIEENPNIIANKVRIDPDLQKDIEQIQNAIRPRGDGASVIQTNLLPKDVYLTIDKDGVVSLRDRTNFFNNKVGKGLIKPYTEEKLKKGSANPPETGRIIDKTEKKSEVAIGTTKEEKSLKQKSEPDMPILVGEPMSDEELKRYKKEMKIREGQALEEKRARLAANKPDRPTGLKVGQNIKGTDIGKIIPSLDKYGGLVGNIKISNNEWPHYDGNIVSSPNADVLMHEFGHAISHKISSGKINGLYVNIKKDWIKYLQKVFPKGYNDISLDINAPKANIYKLAEERLANAISMYHIVKNPNIVHKNVLNIAKEVFKAHPELYKMMDDLYKNNKLDIPSEALGVEKATKNSEIAKNNEGSFSGLLYSFPANIPEGIKQVYKSIRGTKPHETGKKLSALDEYFKNTPAGEVNKGMQEQQPDRTNSKYSMLSNFNKNNHYNPDNFKTLLNRKESEFSWNTFVYPEKTFGIHNAKTAELYGELSKNYSHEDFGKIIQANQNIFHAINEVKNAERSLANQRKAGNLSPLRYKDAIEGLAAVKAGITSEANIKAELAHLGLDPEKAYSGYQALRNLHNENTRFQIDNSIFGEKLLSRDELQKKIDTETKPALEKVKSQREKWVSDQNKTFKKNNAELQKLKIRLATDNEASPVKIKIRMAELKKANVEIKTQIADKAGPYKSEIAQLKKDVSYLADYDRFQKTSEADHYIPQLNSGGNQWQMDIRQAGVKPEESLIRVHKGYKTRKEMLKNDVAELKKLGFEPTEGSRNEDKLINAKGTVDKMYNHRGEIVDTPIDPATGKPRKVEVEVKSFVPTEMPYRLNQNERNANVLLGYVSRGGKSELDEPTIKKLEGMTPEQIDKVNEIIKSGDSDRFTNLIHRLSSRQSIEQPTPNYAFTHTEMSPKKAVVAHYNNMEHENLRQYDKLQRNATSKTAQKQLLETINNKETGINRHNRWLEEQARQAQQTPRVNPFGQLIGQGTITTADGSVYDPGRWVQGGSNWIGAGALTFNANTYARHLEGVLMNTIDLLKSNGLPTFVPIWEGVPAQIKSMLGKLKAPTFDINVKNSLEKEIDSRVMQSQTIADNLFRSEHTPNLQRGVQNAMLWLPKQAWRNGREVGAIVMRKALMAKYPFEGSGLTEEQYIREIENKVISGIAEAQGSFTPSNTTKIVQGIRNQKLLAPITKFFLPTANNFRHYLIEAQKALHADPLKAGGIVDFTTRSFLRMFMHGVRALPALGILYDGLRQIGGDNKDEPSVTKETGTEAIWRHIENGLEKVGIDRTLAKSLRQATEYNVLSMLMDRDFSLHDVLGQIGNPFMLSSIIKIINEVSDGNKSVSQKLWGALTQGGIVPPVAQRGIEAYFNLSGGKKLDKEGAPTGDYKWYNALQDVGLGKPLHQKWEAELMREDKNPTNTPALQARYIKKTLGVGGVEIIVDGVKRNKDSAERELLANEQEGGKPILNADKLKNDIIDAWKETKDEYKAKIKEIDDKLDDPTFRQELYSKIHPSENYQTPGTSDVEFKKVIEGAKSAVRREYEAMAVQSAYEKQSESGVQVRYRKSNKPNINLQYFLENK